MKGKILIISCIFMLMSGSVFASELSEWSKADYESLSRGGILTKDIVSNKLNGNITRREVCKVFVNMYEQINGEQIVYEEDPFTDTDDESVLKAYQKGIVSGKSSNTFDPEGLITREEFAKMVMNLLVASGENIKISDEEVSNTLSKYEDGGFVSEWAEEAVALNIREGIISGTSAVTLSPGGQATREQAFCMANRLYNRYPEKKNNYGIPVLTSCGMNEFGGYSVSWSSADDVTKYTIIVKDINNEVVDTFETTDTSAMLYGEYETGDYTIIIGAKKNNGADIFSLSADIAVSQQYVVAWNDYSYQDNLSLSEKEQRVFPGGKAFSNAAEAEQYMQVVTVPVWKIGKDGSKYSKNVNITVNSALAGDVINIFTEIFNSGEQFPVKDVGGYYWRNTASGKLSQHSYGTCIDINANENYYVQPDGTPIVGSFWKPYESPYSIPEDGIVVRTFAKYGWEWGGNCWSDKYAKDYMHFTYLGK